ncbi:MAG TPA: hypothetical protein VH307_19020 [Streptosporangiaceae bacterium]|nr:hypothetical protein [Streptosporangiaceae bacterium]
MFAAPGTNAHRAKSSSHLDLAVQIHHEWPNIRSEDLQTLEEAKLGLVSRFGEALHMLAARRHECPAGSLGYAQLYGICLMENSYRIRLAAAQEIARGGAVVFGEIGSALAEPGQVDDGSRSGQQEGAGNKDQAGQQEGAGNKIQESRSAVSGHAAGGAPAQWEAQWAQQVSAWLAPLLIVSGDAADGEHGTRSPYQGAQAYFDQ